MPIGELVNETAIDNGDIVLTTQEANQYSNKVLRRMAAEANTDEVNGRSVQLEWVAYFARQRTLGEYEE